jgi:hypothetical protein
LVLNQKPITANQKSNSPPGLSTTDFSVIFLRFYFRRLPAFLIAENAWRPKSRFAAAGPG